MLIIKYLPITFLAVILLSFAIILTFSEAMTYGIILTSIIILGITILLYKITLQEEYYV